jgi:signal transduction histidine kinase
VRDYIRKRASLIRKHLLSSSYSRHRTFQIRTFWHSRCIASRQMLPTSHHAPMNPVPGAVKGPLSEAFNAFMATADRMEASYSQLQSEVARLRRELEEQNTALTKTLAENKNIRTALKRILDALPCGVIVIDANDGIVLVNPEAVRLLGATADAASLLQQFPGHIQTLLKTAISRDDEHEVTVDAEKATRWLSIRRTALHSEASQESAFGPDQFILILRDVTARKEADRQRETSRNMLALGEMAAILAHEIRNPLGSMELWTGVLEKKSAIGDEEKYCVEHLQAGIRSLSATVNNVLQFHGHGSTNLVRLQLRTALQNGMTFIRPLAEQAGVKLEVNLQIDNVEIEGDPNGLQQVILNLAINAFRHTPMGGSLTITARQHGDLAIVDFADTGEGIAETDLAKVFNPGFSGSKQRPGLGLTICQRIMEQHRSTIRVQSRACNGTRFSLEFPIL